MKKLIAGLACMALLITTACGGGEKKKDITIDIPKEMPGHMADVIQFVDTAAVYSFTNNTEKSISEQNWTVEVRVNVVSDAEYAKMADAEIADMSLSILDKDGKEISGQKDFKITPESRKALSELIAKGKGAQGVLTFTKVTNAKNHCDQWFEDAASAKIIFGEITNSGSTYNPSSSSSYNENPADHNPDDMHYDISTPEDAVSEDGAPEDGLDMIAY